MFLCKTHKKDCFDKSKYVKLIVRSDALSNIFVFKLCCPDSEPIVVNGVAKHLISNEKAPYQLSIF